MYTKIRNTAVVLVLELIYKLSTIVRIHGDRSEKGLYGPKNIRNITYMCNIYKSQIYFFGLVLEFRR